MSLRRFTIASLVVLSLFAACKPTPEQISTWKGTQRGPQKLRDVVQDDGAPPELRALAAAALIEIGLASDAAQDLAKMAPMQREHVTHELVAPLAALLGASASQPVPTTPMQRAAKDALFVAREGASAADHARIDTVLLAWITADLTARSSQGGEASEKILRAIGPSAAASLVPLVRPGPDLLLAAKLVGELGDREQVKQATATVTALVRSAPGGVHVVSEQLMKALGFLGGVDATAFLLELATKAGAETRAKALFALAQGHLSAGDDKALKGSLAIVADASAPPAVRDAAFEVAENVGPASVGGLLPLFTDRNEIVRFRAVEAALKAGGASGIARVLAALPEDRPLKSEDLDSYVVHDLTLIGKEAFAPLLAAAKGDKVRPLGQIAAIRALGRMGSATSTEVTTTLAALHGATGQGRPLVPLSLVGHEADRAAAAVGKRK